MECTKSAQCGAWKPAAVFESITDCTLYSIVQNVWWVLESAVGPAVIWLLGACGWLCSKTRVLSLLNARHYADHAMHTDIAGLAVAG
jgi:hypothetical protein